ncbi:Type I inositol polyphosphate 5-phosphatase 4 [Sesamum angolense]|uniref:Type I inositol polyphosphate 5-phosphatase 4 n=1 Tax=Sesamum angolense TaxID=2727404 RepID=A0AAE2BPS5_9LAMI|nr:Type I inositol polyphosphate 5-phosphatase 4 [Sesamum angolense]
MRRELLKRYEISGVKVCSVACGIMGLFGKQRISCCKHVDCGTSFCFIAAHLASGEKKGDEGRRNHQVSEIFRRTCFPRLPEDGDKLHPLTILGHELYLEDNLARQLIKEQDWRALQKFDQLRRELEHGGVFQGWKEGNIEFAPTYKYSSYNCNRCDRILWYGKGVRQLSYFRSESKFSDHRPVSAMFSIQIAVVKSAISSCPTVPTTLMKTETPTEMASGEATPTLLSLIVQDISSPRAAYFSSSSDVSLFPVKAKKHTQKTYKDISWSCKTIQHTVSMPNNIWTDCGELFRVTPAISRLNSQDRNQVQNSRISSQLLKLLAFLHH